MQNEKFETPSLKPKKLIRKFITEKLKDGEWETINDQEELNRLYAIKVREELNEIQSSGHQDIMEFVDLIQVAFSFAKQNGFTHEEIAAAMIEKSAEKGPFGRLALNNLNPNNPSNELYFDGMSNSSLKELIIGAVQDATDTETGMVSIPVLDALLDNIILD